MIRIKIPTPEIYDMFVYKNTEKIEYAKEQPTF